jgi:thiamine kinase-like enzyme
MAHSPLVLDSLKQLPCFDRIVSISVLTEGLSHTCVKVTTASQSYFAKQLNSETAEAEVITSLACTAVSTTQQLSPKVIYHDDNWLITHYVEGMTLTNSTLNNSDKVNVAIELMAKLHRLNQQYNLKELPTLDTQRSVACLLTQPVAFLAQQRELLTNVTELLTKKINAQISLSDATTVLCHGDVNFTNILIDETQMPWLIDFECAHLAHVEFDLAMFIAVNNISTNEIDIVVNCYKNLDHSYQPNAELLTYYILYSFFINGLWYFDNIKDGSDDGEMHRLAVVQWQSFDRFAKIQQIDMPELMAIIDSVSEPHD